MYTMRRNLLRRSIEFCFNTRNTGHISVCDYFSIFQINTLFFCIKYNILKFIFTIFYQFNFTFTQKIEY